MLLESNPEEVNIHRKHKFDYGNPWDFPKDGKRWYGERFPDVVRK
jgi:hypothetical protein